MRSTTFYQNAADFRDRCGSSEITSSKPRSVRVAPPSRVRFPLELTCDRRSLTSVQRTLNGSIVMPPLLMISSPEGNQIRQILSVINCRFLGPNSRYTNARAADPRVPAHGVRDDVASSPRT